MRDRRGKKGAEVPSYKRDEVINSVAASREKSCNFIYLFMHLFSFVFTTGRRSHHRNPFSCGWKSSCSATTLGHQLVCSSSSCCFCRISNKLRLGPIKAVRAPYFSSFGFSWVFFLPTRWWPIIKEKQEGEGDKQEKNISSLSRACGKMPDASTAHLEITSPHRLKVGIVSICRVQMVWRSSWRNR